MQQTWRAALVLGVRDVRAAVNFYVEALEFQCDSVFDGVAAEEGAVYALLSQHGVDVHLRIRRRPRFPEGRESIESDLYLYIDDVNAYYGRICTRNVAVLRPLENSRNYGMRDFMIEDPDGNPLVFGSPS